MIHGILTIVESFIGSMLAFWLISHLDLEEWFHQKHIKHGRKLEHRLRSKIESEV